MKKILVIGATSEIAQATMRLFAKEQASFYLVARNDERLKAVTDDLRQHGAENITQANYDVGDLARHTELVEAACETLGQLDIALVAHGTLPNQEACEQSIERTLQEWNVNATATISLLTLVGNRMETQQFGTLAVITSVAGDRGRKSNYVYGAAKGAVSTFLQGLRNRLHAANVNVINIKPGFVDTPMTAHLEKGGPLWATPATVADGIYKAIEKRKTTVYLPGFWRLIMTVIKSIPEFIFKRLSL
ncbi:MAG: SDR family oxidoreductase [Woeseiaceae bacterium]